MGVQCTGEGGHIVLETSYQFAVIVISCLLRPVSRCGCPIVFTLSVNNFCEHQISKSIHSTELKNVYSCLSSHEDLCIQFWYKSD